MTKKQIIILVSMLVVFFISMVIIFLYHKTKPMEEEISEHHYAVNLTEENTEEDLEETTEEIIEQEKSIIIANVNYNNIDLLTDEQYEDKTKMITLIDNYTKGKVDSIDILETSNDEQVIAVVNYSDNETENIIITYDKYQTHKFMRCVNEEYWNSIQNGENAGVGDDLPVIN